MQNIIKKFLVRVVALDFNRLDIECAWQHNTRVRSSNEQNAWIIKCFFILFLMHKTLKISTKWLCAVYIATVYVCNMLLQKIVILLFDMIKRTSKSFFLLQRYTTTIFTVGFTRSKRVTSNFLTRLQRLYFYI